MAEPLVSIAVCTYNGERFLRSQMDSLLQQSWTNTEIVICDDGSTDGTLAILDSYTSDPRVRLYRNPQNLRLTRNFEKAIGLCTGDYIMLCDQDDVWEKEKIKTMVNAIGNDVLIYSDSLLIDEEGNDMHTRISRLRRMYTGSDTRGFVLSNCVWGHAVLMHSTLKQYLLPLPPDVPHDSWIGFVAANIKRIRYIDQPLTRYRQHNDTVTSTLPSATRADATNRNRKEYMARMHWLKAARDLPRNNDPAFYTTLYDLYTRKANGRFVWPLFFFLLKHRKGLFMFARKSLFSQVNELRKQSRGV